MFGKKGQMGMFTQVFLLIFVILGLYLAVSAVTNKIATKAIGDIKDLNTTEATQIAGNLTEVQTSSISQGKELIDYIPLIIVLLVLVPLIGRMVGVI